MAPPTKSASTNISTTDTDAIINRNLIALAELQRTAKKFLPPGLLLPPSAASSSLTDGRGGGDGDEDGEEDENDFTPHLETAGLGIPPPSSSSAGGPSHPLRNGRRVGADDLLRRRLLGHNTGRDSRVGGGVTTGLKASTPRPPGNTRGVTRRRQDVEDEDEDEEGRSTLVLGRRKTRRGGQVESEAGRATLNVKRMAEDVVVGTIEEEGEGGGGGGGGGGKKEENGVEEPVSLMDHNSKEVNTPEHQTLQTEDQTFQTSAPVPVPVPIPIPIPISPALNSPAIPRKRQAASYLDEILAQRESKNKKQKKKKKKKKKEGKGQKD